MLKIKQAIIVEGKYDKIKLDSLVDALVIETKGFSIFKDKVKLDFIRSVAEKDGIIILTDSDSAGMMIRSYLEGTVNGKFIRNAYVPDVYGKEKRKRKPGKEGKLGVEGVDGDIIIEVLKEAEASFYKSIDGGITNGDLYELGITGGENSRAKKKTLCKALGFPEGMSKNSLLKALNMRIGRDELFELCNKIL